jgi:hypothetical protein
MMRGVVALSRAGVLAVTLAGCATSTMEPESLSEGAQLALRHQLVQEDDIADFSSLIDAQRQVAATRSVIEPLALVPGDGAPGVVTDVLNAVLPGVQVVGLPTHPIFMGALFQDVPDSIVTEREAARTYAARYAAALTEYYASVGIVPAGSGAASAPTFTATTEEYGFQMRFGAAAQALCKSRGMDCRTLRFDGLLKVVLAGRQGAGYAMWGRGADFSLPMDAAIALTQRVPGMKVWIPYASLDDVCRGGYFIREGRTVPVEEVRVQNRCPTTQAR